MSRKTKPLSNAFSTGGGGAHFEAHIQASFVVLLLTGGYPPSLPCWPIKKIKLQGKNSGYETDDLIVFIEKPGESEQRRLLGQVKHSVQLTKGSPIFFDVIQAMWNDFNNPEVFTQGKDFLALLTGPLSRTDTHNVQWLLDHARHTKDEEEFYTDVNLANFSPSKSKEKLNAIRHHLKKANENQTVSDEVLYSFLKHFHLLGYDLGKEVGVVLSLLHSHIGQFNADYPECLWARVVDVVHSWNQNAGTITLDNLPEGLKDAFKVKPVTTIPPELINKTPPKKTPQFKKIPHQSELAIANLIGSWDENSEEDKVIIAKLVNSEYKTFIGKMQEILTND